MARGGVLAAPGALVLLLLVVGAALPLLSRADSGMCTSKPPDGSAGCGAPPQPHHEEEDDDDELDEVFEARHYDLSVALAPGMVLWQSDSGLPADFTSLGADMTKGDPFFATVVKMNVHTGTHVDAPSHYLVDEWQAGNHVHKLDLDLLIGPALVVEVPSNTNITAEVLQSLDLPGSLTRVLFKTQNTQRKLMHQRAFAPDYVGFTTDGAQWLVGNTQIRLVGIDYLSIASLDHLVPGHKVLLGAHVVAVEGLDLEELQAGSWYQLTCLPLKIKDAEGAPARCVAYGPEVFSDVEGGPPSSWNDEAGPSEDEL